MDQPDQPFQRLSQEAEERNWLIWEINFLKGWAEDHELHILFMKVDIARCTIKLRITEAELAKMITLPDTRTSSHAYQNNERLCSYINEIKALGENLETTYLRLRYFLRRGETVDLLEMELLRDLPQHRRQEILQDCEVNLERGIMSIDGLKRDFQNLTAKVQDLEPLESRPTPDSEHLTIEQTFQRNAQENDVSILTWINFQKNAAEDHELMLLDLKGKIAKNTIKFRISEAESVKRITLPNTRFSFHAHQNYERLCSYINEIKALAENLRITYLRLRDRLSQHETVDLSEMELRLPALPQHCHRLIILDLKAKVARNIIKLRISQAESAKMITLPDTRTSYHAHQNDEHLCSYINEVKALGENLRTTYLRLRYRIRRGETVDLSEMELPIPDLPQHCRQTSLTYDIIDIDIIHIDIIDVDIIDVDIIDVDITGIDIIDI